MRLGRQMKAREINDTIRYTMWSVFKRNGGLDDPPIEKRRRGDPGHRPGDQERRLRDPRLVRRGRAAGRRRPDGLVARPDLGHPAGRLPRAAPLRPRRAPGTGLVPARAAPSGRVQQGPRAGVHAGRGGKAYLCVYPFVRSYEWYLLPEEERRAMLTEHGMMARPYPDVRANTVSSFALGDYEWILAFEADELHRIVDLMRALRAAAARRHTREEVPFFTGRRRELHGILSLW